MGEYYTNGSLGHKIRNYRPEDDENTIYIECDFCEISIQDIIEKAQAKWLGISLDQITIEGEKIHTRCLGYDLYDPSDYDDYIILRRKV